ncbi:Serine carboxypeptidases (lysosomal cathepsin A) [Handroanthus impetiginosus]|uniref:Serine carboxypeptidases (Lysosomal cathepsin A) n=1 Tax=Handroanthus impetiginosus TaxID=429701 RepID=A0A2G9GTG5_9LAMI|nr:Serine carboxypeptidases (lysosomal cathepsin A) [Handroanthus impetiginosus]
MKSFISLHVFFLVLIKTTSSQSIIKTLPGYPGPLPFKLETGYISVGEDDEIQLFYYFIESERDPATDPLVLWLTGGPGCSGFSGLVIEIGPLAFDLETFDGSFPSFIINPYSWTKVASIIFIDAPVGTGFSYSTASKGYSTSDTKSVNDNYLFLRKWLLKHPEFLKNRLYVAGDSYGGKTATMVALEIAKGNEAGLQPQMLLQLAKRNCHGEYVNPDPNNYKCLYALQQFDECTKFIRWPHILEPRCISVSPKPNDFLSGRLFPEDDPLDLIFLSEQERPWCRNNNYLPTSIWANNEMVQEALHVRKGTITNWTRCNGTLSYEYDVDSILKDHQLLSEKGYQVLAYSGDHDLLVTYMSTLKWIRKLNLTIDDQWRPWYLGGQIAGYTEKYKNNQAYITFATVKGGGHTAPEYMPKECLAMIDRWLSLFPL